MTDENSLRFEGWRVAAAAGSGVFFAALAVYGFAVLLRPLTVEFAWSRETAATAYSCLALASALAGPILGRLVDRFGPVRIAVPGLIVNGIGIASLAALGGSPVHLYLIFSILGVGATATSALAYSRAIATWFDRRRGAALAIVIAGGAAASMAHPPAVDALIRGAGWRAACLVMGGVVLVVGVPLVAAFVRERQSRESAPVTATAGATLGDAVRSWTFWTLILVAAAGASALSGVVIHLVALLTDRGVPPARAALALSLMGAAGLIGRLITGWLIDRFPATVVSAALLALAAAGLFILSGTPSFNAALLAGALIGLGMGGELDVTPFLLSRYFGLRSLSTLYGVGWMATSAGAAAGSVLMGRAFDAAGSYDAMLTNLAAAALLAALLMLTLPAYRTHHA